MRNNLLFSFIVFLLYPFYCVSQEFMDESNQWVYKRVSMNDLSFFKYNWGDNVRINNHDLKEMEVTLIRFVGDPNAEELTRLPDTILEPLLINVQDDLVQYYNIENEEFYPMFLLEAVIGEDILHKYNPNMLCEDTYPTEEWQTVISVDTEIIVENEISYHIIENQSFFTTGEKVYNQIGGSMSLFPIPLCEIADVNVGLPERIVCFSNDNMNLNFQSNGNNIYSCSSLLNTRDFALDLNDQFNIQIVPNPVKFHSNVFAQKELNERVEIYSISGKLLKTMIMKNNSIDLSEFEKGIYFLKFEFIEKNTFRTIKVIKR